MVKITLCGSMVFAPEMVELGRELKRRGHQADLRFFTKQYAKMNSKTKMHHEATRNKIKYDLIRKYYRKIKRSQAVLIVNITRNGVRNYIGGNSLIEMAFAHILRKKIYLLNPMPKMKYTDEIAAMQPLVLKGDLDGIK